MSVEFSNMYQEILLDNLVSIIKQNFIFQTQLKLAESGNKGKAELQSSYDILNGENVSLKQQLSELERLKSRVESNDSAHEEKSRIQTALNDELKRSADLKRTIEEKDGEISSLKNQILKLESEASGFKDQLLKLESETLGFKEQILKLESSILNSKPKKSNSINVPELVEPTPLTLLKTKVSDGSTF
jgi:chromosome segregation ATPase